MSDNNMNGVFGFFFFGKIKWLVIQKNVILQLLFELLYSTTFYYRIIQLCTNISIAIQITTSRIVEILILMKGDDYFNF